MREEFQPPVTPLPGLLQSQLDIEPLTTRDAGEQDLRQGG